MGGARKSWKRLARAAGWGCIIEGLESRTLLSALTINGTSGNDYISLSGTSGSLMQVDVNGVITDYNPFDYTSIVIQGVGGTDTFNILGNELPTTIIGAGPDTVEVGDSNGVQDINSSINITDPPNYASISLSDAGDATVRTINLNYSGTQGQVLGFAPAAITYATTDYSSLTVTTGSAADNVNVLGTPTNTLSGGPQVSVTSSGSGIDNVVVGNATNGVQNILAPLSVSGDIGFNHSNLTVDDSKDTGKRTASISSTAINGLAPAPISYNPAGLNSLYVGGGSGGNAFTVASTPGVITTTLDSGTGSDAMTVQSTSSNGQLYLYGDSGINIITLGNAGSVQGILSPVTLVNLSGSDALTLDDSSDNVARKTTISNIAVTNLAPAQIQFTLDDLLSLTVDGGSAGNTFTLNGTPGQGCVTNLNSGTGADVVNVIATSPSAVLNVQGQSGADIVNVTNSGNVQGVSGTVNVENTGYYTTLIIDDSTDSVGRVVTLNAFTPVNDTPFGSITGLAPAVINYEVADVTSPVVIDGGSGGNTFNVQNTPSGSGHSTTINCGLVADHVNILGTGASTTLNVEGEGGADVVNVGNNGSVQGVLGTVNITNAPAFSTLTIDDSADTSGRTVTLSTFTPNNDTAYGSVTGLCPGTINYRYNDIATPITIDGGVAGNTFNLSTIAPGNATILNTGTGNDIVNVSALAVTATLTINGHGGSDTINLDYTSGNPLPHLVNLSGLFTLNGLKGANTLNGTTMNISRSTIYINYVNPPSDPLALLRAYLLQGYNNGAWNGVATASTGAINSLPAAQNALQTTAIGYADSADGLIPGQPANTIELKYTLYGDTTLTGSVGFNDFTRLTQHYNQTSGGAWDTGDFNYDGSVNFNDFTLMTRTYNSTLGSQSQPAAAAATVGSTAVPPALQVKPRAAFIPHTPASQHSRKRK